MEAATDPALASKLRRTYGRGFHDGMAAMNQTKMARVEDDLTHTERKVLDVVPIEEVWSLTQIASEMKRRGINMDLRVVQGVLNHLCDCKLIKEDQPRQFIRKGKTVMLQTATQTPAPAAPVLSVVAPAPVAVTPAAPVPLLVKFDALARDLRALAATVEDLALEVEARAQSSGDAANRLRKLQELLLSSVDKP